MFELASFAGPRLTVLLKQAHRAQLKKAVAASEAVSLEANIGGVKKSNTEPDYPLSHLEECKTTWLLVVSFLVQSLRMNMTSSADSLEGQILAPCLGRAKISNSGTLEHETRCREESDVVGACVATALLSMLGRVV